jgi:hypothetical protein
VDLGEGPKVTSVAEMYGQFAAEAVELIPRWRERLSSDPSSLAELEPEVHAAFATQVSRAKVGGEDVLVFLVPDVTKGRDYSMEIIHVAPANSPSPLLIRMAGLRVGGDVNAVLPLQWRSVGPTTSRPPQGSGKKYTSQRFAFAREMEPKRDKSVVFDLILEFEGNRILSQRIELEPLLVMMHSAM